MSDKLEKIESPKAVEVVELEDTMLDTVAGGVAADISGSLNIDCDKTVNEGCNTVAGCGGKG
ncbi:hypothetical protein BO221_00595 [Archangium sp. Cb G35]|uniref:hypothetical protein n=1 Tax=Archangium sp. Cb G35 TaxID=1920190 RepID=UPI000935B43E|nr:hypothetical protein [Archangium sp. Cb G35]OJT26578.1 hypothetical protein BO221_00595 [Archangium sp. Cb G35]